jgi:hypothetical protein
MTPADLSIDTTPSHTATHLTRGALSHPSRRSIASGCACP